MTDTRWRDLAACRTEDPDLFFSRSTAEAVSICWSICPVRATCLAWAMETRQKHGVWGGLDEGERFALRRSELRAAARARNAAQPPPKPVPGPMGLPDCGTQRGYRAHLARKEPTCPACRAAHADAERRLYAPSAIKNSPERSAA